MTVKCHVVVADDIESGRIEDIVGVSMEFVAMPRVGESISDFGTVIEISHMPTGLPDQLPYASVTLYTTRKDPNPNRT